MPREPRTNGSRFFLTYSQATNLDIDELADFIADIAPCWLEIVQENHQDNGIHYHVVVCFESRLQRPLNIFDCAGYHPNILPIKNATVDLSNRRHYIRKGAERSEEDQHTIKSHKLKACDYVIEPDTRGDVPPYTTTSGRLDFGGILATAESEAQFYELVRLHQPKEWVLRNDQIVKYGSTHYKAPVAPPKVYPAESFIVPPALDEWTAQVFSEVSFIPARSHVPPLV